MMPRSLAFLTDMIFHRQGGRGTDLGDCIMVETPDRPEFYFGNFLHFPEPPCVNDLTRWPAQFAAAFAARPGVQHVAFSWEGPIGAAEAFVALGYRLERSVVLSAQAVSRPPRCDDSALVRALATDDDFRSSLANQVAERDTRFTSERFEGFMRDEFRRWRRMQGAGLGAWHGAFVERRLAADCGLFFDDDAGVGRFQAVNTHPDFRRRGLCGRLVWEVARAGLYRVPTLVMVADALYHAARIYESVGFQPTQTTYSVYLEPPATPPTRGSL